MRAQHKRCRDCQREVKPGFVGTPAERESHQDQQQDENDERHNFATAGNRFEDVAQRIDRGVGVNELVGIWQTSRDGPRAHRSQVADDGTDPKPDHRNDAQSGKRACKRGQCSPRAAGDEKDRYE